MRSFHHDFRLIFSWFWRLLLWVCACLMVFFFFTEFDCVLVIAMWFLFRKFWSFYLFTEAFQDLWFTCLSVLGFMKLEVMDDLCWNFLLFMILQLGGRVRTFLSFYKEIGGSYWFRNENFLYWICFFQSFWNHHRLFSTLFFSF